jgi:predicted enzyme related to lactoylglutathione lyase
MSGIAPGTNIAVKVPVARFEATVRFYRDAAGLDVVADHGTTVGFSFGAATLWIDAVPTATHAEVWLELAATDVDSATERLVAGGGRVADEIEPLDRPDRHWIIDPGGTVLLLTTPDPAGDEGVSSSR